MKQKLEIMLLSDMLPGMGIGFGASVDADVCADSLGIPYIPGRRIKGCLREAGYFAARLGVSGCDEANMDALFGTEETEGALRLENALLEGEARLRPALQSKSCPPWLTPVNVLNAYSGLRSQTAISEGVAANNTLRVSRVLRSGLRFECRIEYPKALEETLKNCVRAFTHMGSMRTRGLGHIRATLADAEKKTPPVLTQGTLAPDDSAMLAVRFRLNSPVIVADTYGKSTCVQIPGSTMRGAILSAWRAHKGLGANANLMKEPDFRPLFLDGEVLYAPATISDAEGNAYERLPVSIVEYKDAPVDGYQYRDTAVEPTERLNKSVGALYVAKRAQETDYTVFDALEVQTRVSYHQSTRSDTLFQYTAIERGQFFRAEIFGPTDRLRKLATALEAHPGLTIGRSRSAEYGAAQIVSLDLKRDPRGTVSDANGEYAAVLSAPACLTDETGMCATDAQALLGSLERNLPGFSLTLNKAFLRFRAIGGYNPQWQLAKPMTQAVDSGTTLVFTAKISGQPAGALPARVRIGGRRSEGMGDVRILPMQALRANVKINKVDPCAPQSSESEEYRALLSRVARQEVIRQLSEYARRHPLTQLLNRTTLSALIKAVDQATDAGAFAQCLVNIANADKRAQVLYALLNTRDEVERNGVTERIVALAKCVSNNCGAFSASGISEWEALQIVLLRQLKRIKEQTRGKGGNRK